MNAALAACGGTPPGVSQAVLSVWLGPDNKYSFVELCSADCATIALGLNGITFMGMNLRIARPKTYTDATTSMSSMLYSVNPLLVASGIPPTAGATLTLGNVQTTLGGVGGGGAASSTSGS